MRKKQKRLEPQNNEKNSKNVTKGNNSKNQECVKNIQKVYNN